MLDSKTSIILRNTILLYGRMLVTMWLNLLATRLVLRNLGVDDMGVYGVVGSVVNMFAVFTNGITIAVQRFISYELGKGDDGNVNRVFCTSVNILIIFSVLMAVILEVAGLWTVTNYVNIPVGRMDTALWVFHFAVLTCICGLMTIPYNAMVIAYEKMDAFAVISIINVALTCAACYMLSLLQRDSRLGAYAMMMALIAAMTPLMYKIYCTRKFRTASYHPVMDKEVVKGIRHFTFISSMSGVFMLISGQGITLVINWTFGVALNAVYNIALQLKNMVLSFSLNLFKAIQPQITKSYAEGDMKHYKRLVYSGSKLEVFLIFFIMIPFLFRTHYILGLWLGEVPRYTEVFCQCTILLSLAYAAFEPIRTAVLATNDITRFMLVPDALTMLALPVSYMVAKMTDSPELMIVSVIGVDIVCCAFRVVLGAKVSILRTLEILKFVVLRCLLVASISVGICYYLAMITPETLGGLFFMCLFNSMVLCLVIFFVGLTKEERLTALSLIKRRSNSLPLPE